MKDMPPRNRFVQQARSQSYAARRLASGDAQVIDAKSGAGQFAASDGPVGKERLVRRRSVSHVLCLCLALVTALSLTVSLVAAQDGGRRKDPNQNADDAASATSGLIDSDADYLPDYMDNCPFVQNPNQPDTDGDGTGDHCDDTPQGEPPAPPEQVEVTGPAEAERTDQTTWDPGVVTVEDAAAGDETASGEGALSGSGDDGEPVQEIELASSQRDPAATDTTAAGFAATESGVAGPPGYSSVFVPPGIPVDDGQSEPREPPQVPEESFAVIARIDAGVVAPRDGARAEPVGSVARDLDVAAFMRKDKKSPTLTDLGLQSNARDLLPDTSPTPAPEPPPTAPAAAAATATDVTEAIGAPPAPDWDYDAYYAGGLARDRLAVPDIEGTDEPELYFSQRRGDARGKPGEFSYAIPVPEDGVYQVRLHFAEIYWGADGGGPGGRNKRVFSVDAEGDQVLADYDIYEDVGAMTAVVKQFSIAVNDGVLDLRFYGKRDQPMVAGIEVLGAPQGERWVDVRLAERVVRLMVGGTVVAEYAASFGEPGHATPTGSFLIQNKIAGLSWSPYAQNYFTYWAAFDQANELGFHSWTMDESGQLVGNADGPTWGCIATAPADAAAIYDFVTVGTRVEISS